MKKTALFIITLLSLMTAMSQNETNRIHAKDCSFDLDITRYDKFEERSYIIARIYDDPRFMITVGNEDGLFVITTNPDYDDIDFSSIFTSYLNDISDDFNSLTKVEAADYFYMDKSKLPEYFITNLMMGTINRDGNGLCSGALPFCTDNGLYQFPAGVDTGQGESGPCYNYNSKDLKGNTPCLLSTPNPAWYYMRINNPGNIQITINSTPRYDIDYTCWGPFDDYLEPCPHNGVTQLTCDKVVSCSYAGGAGDEICTISNAIQGKYYILLLTNYDNHACNINFSKTAGSGTTDCSILPPMIDYEGDVCYGGTITLTAQDIADAQYNWTGPNGFTSTLREPVINNLNFNKAGTYSCSITKNGQTSDPISMYVSVLPNINSNFTMSEAGVGTPMTFTGTESTNPAGYNDSITARTWDFGDGGTAQGNTATHTYNTPGTYEVTYTVVAESYHGESCEDTKTSWVCAYDPPTIEYDGSTSCYGSTLQLTTPQVNGVSYSWTGPNGFTSNVREPHIDNVSLLNSGTYTCAITVPGQCESMPGELNIEILPELHADFTVINTIPGVNAQFTGTETTTPNNHTDKITSWTWDFGDGSPVVTGPNPTHMYTTPGPYEVTYTIVAENDNGGHCEDTKVKTITVTNNLSSSVSCDNSVLCQEEQTTLHANAFGGTQNYTYSWAPAELVVNPTSATTATTNLYATTTFTCSISDGFDVVENQCTVIVHPKYTTPTTSNHIVSCEPYTYNFINPETQQPDQITLYETSETLVNVSSSHGCDSLVKLVFTRHYPYEEQHPENYPEYACKNQYGYYQWGSQQYYDGGIIINSVDFKTQYGCDSIAKKFLTLYDRPTVDEQISGIGNVMVSGGMFPSIYSYELTGLSGGGIENDYPPTYHWEIFSYYDTPNNINGECSWTLMSDSTSNNAQVFINSYPGNALLKCTITNGLCVFLTSSIFLYTDGYEEGASIEETDYSKCIEIYPNPTSDEIYIEFASNVISSDAQVNIYNFSGQLVESFISNTKGNVEKHSVKNYANGVYFINIIGREFTVTKKITVSK